ncbi:MAG: hypothetical protein EPO52_17585 [Herbiconiux sp.]|uniref:hypothetical protein n=1 Tax=Herbiconiux sp. TaxID=1871186 RepID=UPI00120ACC5F|nr:hypothetical protein [Herbiconiux sp.]TAJ46345.1 MAG: hypothetical protein EPO52_17585 [Herbiconiux sp.]
MELLEATDAPVMQKVLAHTPWVRTEDLDRMRGDGESWEYDLALALGYGPRSFDGMWKLTQRPFTYRAGLIIAREVVYEPGTRRSILDGDHFRTRLVAHRVPRGWRMIREVSMLHPDRYILVPPDTV